MADLVERRTACMCQDVEIGSHAVSVGLKLPSHMQDYSDARVAAGFSPDIAVDACLVGEIRSLWLRGIRTYGCCCGHNKVRGMINVHKDDAEAMRAMGYEQWPIEEGYHPWTFYPRSTRADVAALEAEASKGERWQPIETAPKNRKILAGYHNPLGNWRTITACYHTHLPWSDEENPEDGSEYAPEGWYEESDTAETIYRTRDDPTHWMPLPAPPQDNREG